MFGYISKQKLMQLWHPKEENENLNKLNYTILRVLSHYYLREQVVSAIINSKRMPNDSKPAHLRVRRKMLQFLGKYLD
jgi:hypothetical protein